MQIKKDNIKQIFTGKPIMRKDLVKPESWKKETIVCAFNQDQFIGMYKIVNEDEVLLNRKDFLISYTIIHKNCIKV